MLVYVGCDIVQQGSQSKWCIHLTLMKVFFSSLCNLNTTLGPKPLLLYPLMRMYVVLAEICRARLKPIQLTSYFKFPQKGNTGTWQCTTLLTLKTELTSLLVYSWKRQRPWSTLNTVKTVTPSTAGLLATHPPLGAAMIQTAQCKILLLQNLVCTIVTSHWIHPELMGSKKMWSTGRSTSLSCPGLFWPMEHQLIGLKNSSSVLQSLWALEAQSSCFSPTPFLSHFMRRTTHSLTACIL